MASRTDHSPVHEDACAKLFSGPGEMRALCRAFDWGATPLGPVAGWPQSLRTAVDICLSSAVASYVWWGRELVQIYNDAAIGIVRSRHPSSLGAAARVAWADVWPVVGGMIEGVLTHGDSVREDDMPIVPKGGGPAETAWFTFSYSPVRDESGAVHGVFCTALETMRRRLADVEEAERRRLARELHDELGQDVTAFRLGLDDATRLAGERVPPDAALLERLAQLQVLAERMSLGVRTIALELRPPELDDVGLAAALETYVADWTARYGVAADVAVIGVRDRAIPAEVGSAVYRIAQEALTNVAKHAGATQVSVILEQPEHQVRLIVEDDGRGFDPAETNTRSRLERRLGLSGMRERAALVGGTVTVESSPGAGTSLFVRLPTRPSGSGGETNA